LNKSLKELQIKLDILNLHEQGLSNRAIGRELGIGESTIRAFLNKQTHVSFWNSLENQGDCIEDELEVKPFIGFNKPPKINLPPRTRDNAEIYDLVEGFLKGSNERQKDNSRILLISDLHVPYHHPDSLDFLQHLKDKYNPTRVICLGDELDKHALSFHDSDPDLPSAGDELRLALPVIKKLKEMFPVMDILESNHGSLLYRKAHAHGIPRQYLKSYNEVLGVDDGWQWHYDMVLNLPNGNKCYLHHGKSANVTKTSQTMSMCAVQGHYHETFKIEYWGNPVNLYWAMQAGCLIDDKSYAFNYNNVNLKRPIIGTGLIIDSMPVLEAMVLNGSGRWVGN
jgi:hypothetical protein